MIGGDKPAQVKPAPLRYYRKKIDLLRLIDKIKLWPSRKGLLHGIKELEPLGNQVRIITHCGRIFVVNNSRTSRAARWLRNKWFKGVCRQCRVPDWKLEKYNATRFKRHYGSFLQEKPPDKS